MDGQTGDVVFMASVMTDFWQRSAVTLTIHTLTQSHHGTIPFESVMPLAGAGDQSQPVVTYTTLYYDEGRKNKTGCFALYDNYELVRVSECMRQQVNTEHAQPTDFSAIFRCVCVCVLSLIHI